eukprot:RCo009840
MSARFFLATRKGSPNREYARQYLLMRKLVHKLLDELAQAVAEHHTTGSAALLQRIADLKDDIITLEYELQLLERDWETASSSPPHVIPSPAGSSAASSETGPGPVAFGCAGCETTPEQAVRRRVSFDDLPSPREGSVPNGGAFQRTSRGRGLSAVPPSE